MSSPQQSDDEEENDISSQYLNPEQIKVYLEACLNKRVYNFTIETEIDETLYDTNRFEKLKAEKAFKNSENLFYRVWIYQYDGLKEYYISSDKKSSIQKQSDSKNENDKKKAKTTFRFSLGNINLDDLQRENLNIRKKDENPNVNLDEFNPKPDEIRQMRKDLKIIFAYANIGRPLLEEEIEVETTNETKNRKFGDSTGGIEPKYLFKYEFDPDKVVYSHCIKFDLDDYSKRSTDDSQKQEDDFETCKCLQNEGGRGGGDKMYWDYITSHLQNKKIQRYCSTCFKRNANKRDGMLNDIVILGNSKYSIRYFNYCKEKDHYTKKYEYYCNNCNKAYCIYCLLAEHKDPSGTHELVEVKSKDINSFKSDYDQKINCITTKEKKNESIWEEINAKGDKAEISLREREKQAIIEVKTEIMERCLFLTSIGFELERIIDEIEKKKNFIEHCRANSNVANYFCMSYMFQSDLIDHYSKNLDILESLNLDKFTETFHKIDKKEPKKK